MHLRRLSLLLVLLASARCGLHELPLAPAGQPQEGERTAGAFPRATERPLRLRVLVSGSYAAQGIGTHDHIRTIVRDADGLFWSSVGAHLVLAEIVDGWKVDVGQSAEAIRALMDEGSREGVDVVVGMLGGASKRDDDTLGRGALGGGYMVVRSEDSESGRQHDLAVVTFLHELGHALGARHDDEPGSFMNAPVAPSSRSYGRAATEVIRSGLARVGIASDPFPALRRAGVSPSNARPSIDATHAMAPADRQTFARALDTERRGDAQAAWHTAEALFAAYPQSLEVQDLRCRLAQARELPWPDVREACGPLMRLMTPGANPLE
jgi:hypothetical protein